MSCNQYEIGKIGPLGKGIKDLVIRTDTFIVYMDMDDTIQWATIGYGEFDENFGEIQNKVSDWESKVNNLFRKRDAYDIKCILAEAYARILDDRNILLARDIINRAIDTIQKQGSEILKQYYAISSFIMTLLVGYLIYLSKYNKHFIEHRYGRDEYIIWMTMLFGGIGAFIFTIIRLRNYKPDIVISKSVHSLDGFLRIFYGIIAGLIIAIAIKSNFVLGLLNQTGKDIYVTSFLGICAGASEVIIPNLVKQIEVKSTGE
jgi:hypothetical protein